MQDFATTDLCDANEERVELGVIRVLAPGMLAFGRRRRFFGKVTTLSVFEDNTLVRATVEKPGEGRVLFVDGGGSSRVALFGGNLAALAAQNAWQGIVINGAVRDADELDACDIGVRALSVVPLRSKKLGGGSAQVTLNLQGVEVRPDDWCYADRDGIIVSSVPLLP
ncbi:MAG: ribonuclease E activity regulator RraA [Casimicrobiaceae bacterium]